MATIRPFKAIRPDKKYADKVASKPYDVLNSKEARIEAKGDKYTFLHVVKSEIDLHEEVDIHSNVVYETAKKNLDNFIKEGVLIQDSEPMLYIYAQTMDGRTQYGLVGCAAVTEYENNIIKKHEFTRKDKEDDRYMHVKTTNVNSGPVFLTYKDHEGINDIVKNFISKNAPTYSFIKESVKHEVWPINDKDIISNIVKCFKEVKDLYVADGHHRSAATSRVGVDRRKANLDHNGNEEYNFFLAVYFPASHLMIMDYNRVVKDLNHLTKDEFLTKIKKSFDVEITGKDKPEKEKTFSMYLDKNWYTLKPKKGTYSENDPVNSLDVAILQNNLLDPILGIKDPRTDNRIDFVGGIRGTKELVKMVDEEGYSVAFAVYPASIESLMKVADAGLTMPPKSTWFEPKLRSGLLIHSLD